MEPSKKPNHYLYELKKQQIKYLPLTPNQYEQMIRKIAKECGV